MFCATNSESRPTATTIATMITGYGQKWSGKNGCVSSSGSSSAMWWPAEPSSIGNEASPTRIGYRMWSGPIGMRLYCGSRAMPSSSFGGRTGTAVVAAPGPSRR